MPGSAVDMQSEEPFYRTGGPNFGFQWSLPLL
jgi:hypothetical protein